MRLIDADELEKVMTEDWFLEILATQDSKGAIKKDIVNCIDSVPLAFDVESVVAELKECYYEFFSMAQHDKENPFNEGVQKGYKCALEIVRNGGGE